jgi:3',5'-cyclic-AMP phosphodiesterase
VSEPTWLLGHISDLHLGGRETAGDRAEAVLAHLAGLHRPPDALVLTGDLSDAGQQADYQWLGTRLGRFAHVVAVPGNHDDRDAFRATLLAGATGRSPGPGSGLEPVPGPGPVNTVHEVNGLVILGCDSSVPGEDSGLLSDETLAWADTALTEVNPAAPAVLAFHHPPVLLHDPWMDGMRQFGADRLAGLLSRHSRVRALLCGHVHQAVSARFAGVPLIAAPSVAPGLRMPWEADLTVTTPPAFAVHALTESGDLTSYLRLLPGSRYGG